MSSKKITYSNDFKVKVLDYYFKHGGDEKFGLKKKTASHFNIDKKTINRMLNNPEMVKRARRLIASRKVPVNTKPPPPSSRHPVKPAVKKAGATQNRTTATGRTLSSSQCASSSSLSSKSTSSSTKAVSVSKQPANSNTTPTKQRANTAASNKPKPGISPVKNSPGVEVFELPEDPDYSLLKRSINNSSNGVAGLARLLVTGTEEVRNVILNECDVIVECKVCLNLFRSIVNFLAHKRIYCQDEFADVRPTFHRGDLQGLTSQSRTLVVEPEPPPEKGNVNRTPIPTTYGSPNKSAIAGGLKRSGIDSIALKLARKRKVYHASLSSSTHSGSSSYYQSLQDTTSYRERLSRDCSVVLEDINNASNAVYQTFVPPDSALPSTSMSCLVDEAANSKSGITVAINQAGEIVKTVPGGDITSMDVEEEESPSSSDSKDLMCLLCNTKFATQKTLSVHQRSHHGLDRCIYSCPICQASFLSMWSVVKHLQRAHAKRKTQIDTLKKVIRKNVHKKRISHKRLSGDTSEPLKSTDEDLNGVKDDDDEEEEDAADASEESTTPTVPKVEAIPKKIGISNPMQTSPIKPSSHKDDEELQPGSPEHPCEECNRIFSTESALVSHGKFCSLMQMAPPESPMSPRLRSVTPEKKITIQIRKDYKKPVLPLDLNTAKFSDGKNTQVMFKIPKTAQARENQVKIEEMMKEFCNIASFSCIPCGRKYQNVTTLKRHAAFHIDWTRFECSLCQYKNYNRYEIINHCTTKHNVKESVANTMVIEAESVGELKYFLDDEENCAQMSSTENQDQPEKVQEEEQQQNKETEQQQEELQQKHIQVKEDQGKEQKEQQPCVSDVPCPSSVKDSETPTAEDMDFENKHPAAVGNECELQPECASSCQTDMESKASLLATDSVLTCQNDSKSMETNPLIREENDTTANIESSEEFKPPPMDSKDVHPELEVKDIVPSKPEEISSSEKTKTSESIVKAENPCEKNDDSVVNLSEQGSQEVKEICDVEMEVDEKPNQENSNNCMDDTLNTSCDTLKLEELSSNELNISSQNSEVFENQSPNKSESGSDVCDGDKNVATCNTSTDEHISKSEAHNAEKLKEEFKEGLLCVDVKQTSKVEELNIVVSKWEDVNRIQTEVKEESSPIVCDIAFPNKFEDSESISSSCLETSEQESVTECSEYTSVSHSLSKGNTEDEIIISESDSEILLDDFKDVASVSGEIKKEWKSFAENQDFLHETKDFNIHTFENPNMLDLCEPDNSTSFSLPIKTEDEVKPIAKDDLSLELKDFVGFPPSTKVEIYERSHRVRRSLEHKDFIYEKKKVVSCPMEDESESDCDILVTNEKDVKACDILVTNEKDVEAEGEKLRLSLRRRSSLSNPEVAAKKARNEEGECSQDSCNGSSLNLTSSTKIENRNESSIKTFTSKGSEISGLAGSPAERKVRLVRTRLSTSPCDSATSIDSKKSKTIVSCRGKSSEKLPESDITSSKVLLKESTTTRYSSRLKLSGSPVPKIEEKQGIVNTRILTNGQVPSKSEVSTSSKVKL